MPKYIMLCRISAELGKTGNWQNFRQHRNSMVVEKKMIHMQKCRLGSFMSIYKHATPKRIERESPGYSGFEAKKLQSLSYIRLEVVYTLYKSPLSC